MKRLLFVCALFAPLCPPLTAMDPGAGPNEDAAAPSYPSPKNFRRAPKDQSEMWQILKRYRAK